MGGRSIGLRAAITMTTIDPAALRECRSSLLAARLNAIGYALAVKNSCCESRIVAEMLASTREPSDVPKSRQVPQKYTRPIHAQPPPR
jgi:hypothetical protein